MTAQDRTPESCTLPAADRPLRTAEFDALFQDTLRGVERPGPTTLRLTLDGTEDLIARVADLTAREAQCCSFLGFELVPGPDGLLLEVRVSSEHVAVLDGIADQAASARTAG